VDNALRMIAESKRGALGCLHNGTRGFGIDCPSGGIAHRILLHRDPRSKEACEDGTQRAQRTLRQVGLGGQILSDLGIHRIRLLTNTPTHVPALQGFGIEIVEQVRVPVGAAAVTGR
jgi:3,4-dihydroxy 2-butanone 4-phosphate synthase / GTP cyclohydrolase II